MNKLIDGIYGFTEEYQWLSNMYKLDTPIVDEHGIEYWSSENYYVAAKTDCIETKKHISNLSPKQAKTYGRKLVIPLEWNVKKIDVMKDALFQKFTKNENLRNLLLGTGDLYIEETNYWKDTFWGVCDGVGTNVLGNLLMELRDQLKDINNE